MNSNQEKLNRILLVDDDIPTLEVSERMIQRLGYNVISHSSSQAALTLFQDLPEQFDLLITDFKMPELNGAELSKKVLNIRPDIPIIMCSGYASKFYKEDAYQIGIKYFARKPLMKKDFAQLIENAFDND